MLATPGRIFAATVLAILAAAQPANASARVVISGGEARLTLDRGLTRELRRESVHVEGIGAGTASGRLITLPVVAGATNGAAGLGALTVAGGFSFDSGPRAARVGDILLNTGKGQSTARITGTHRILAKHGALQASPAGFGTRIRISDLSLTAGTAAALDRKLGLPGVFRPGQRLGSLTIVAIPESVQIRPKVGAFELMGIRAVANQFIADQLNARFAMPGLFQAGETLARITVTLHAAVAD